MAIEWIKLGPDMYGCKSRYGAPRTLEAYAVRGHIRYTLTIVNGGKIRFMGPSRLSPDLIDPEDGPRIATYDDTPFGRISEIRYVGRTPNGPGAWDYTYRLIMEPKEAPNEGD